ncbi:MAG: hypothetical protein IJS71_03205 [Clostridia bacterium]|nr:hypothetical protein [Clostridia bacterium]
MIIKSSIAGINTKFDTDNKHIIKNLDVFRHDFRGEPSISVKVNDLELRNYMEKYGGNDENADYRLTADSFFNALPEFDGFGIKAATVSIRSKNIVIAAAGEKAKLEYLNALLSCGPAASLIDDAYSAIRKLEGKLYVFGTPWSSKVESNKKLELSAIVIPSDVTSIKKAERKEILDRMLICLTLPKRAEQLPLVLANVDGIEADVPVLLVPENDPSSLYSYMEFGISG